MPQAGSTGREARLRPILRAGAVLAVSLLVGGCAYFNTFYHAKKYYAQGERVRIEAEKKGQIAPNNEAYKKCIEKCEKLIETYPDSKWQDDAHLLMAKAAYGRQDYLFAESTLRHFQEKFPDSKLLPEALYWTGLTAFGDEDYAEARATWQDLLKRFPDYDDRESVEFYLAEAAWKGGETETAANAFEEFLRRYPDGKRSTEARLDLAQLLMDDKQYDRASQILGYITNKGKVEEDRLKAQMLWGEALEAQHKDDEALDLYVNLELQLDPNVMKGRMDPEMRRQAIEKEKARLEAARQDSLLNSGFLSDSSQAAAAYQQNPEGAAGGEIPVASPTLQRPGAVRRNVNDARQRQLGQAMLREGQVLVRLEKPLEAIEVYQQVVAEYTGTALAAEAQYRIAYVNEVFLQNFVQAQAEYAKVSRHGQSAFRQAADIRANNLARVRNLRASAEGDSLSEAQSAAAEARFMRAELYLFQQEDPDRALEEYQAIETEFAGTKHAAKAGLAIAWVDRSRGDTTAAMAKYAEVAEQYPETEYGQRAADVVHGPEKEPELIELAGPTIQQLRDPENLALLSPEAEAALSKMDEDVAEAQARREAQRQAQAEARAAGTPAEPPASDGTMSLGDVVQSTPGMRAAMNPGTGDTPAGSVGGNAPGSEGVLPAGNDAGDIAEETAEETAALPEPSSPSIDAAAAQMTMPAEPGSGETGDAVPGTDAAETGAAKPDAADTGVTNPDGVPLPKPDVASAADAAPPSPAPSSKPKLDRKPGKTAPLPADEPFFWERPGAGPNPLVPVTGAPRPASHSRPPAVRTTDPENPVPETRVRVPRGLYLDPLAVPEAEAPPDSGRAPVDSTGHGEDR